MPSQWDRVDAAPPQEGDLPVSDGVDHHAADVDGPPVLQGRPNGGFRDSPLVHSLYCVLRHPGAWIPDDPCFVALTPASDGSSSSAAGSFPPTFTIG